VEITVCMLSHPMAENEKGFRSPIFLVVELRPLHDAN